ncbi:MAG: DUF2029 domain-containing protein [Nitrospirae bacterium]|nr:MAG: DUF2029 domain-containing protein [Nitrospirota bacterium]
MRRRSQREGSGMFDGAQPSRGICLAVILLMLVWGLTDVRRRADIDTANIGAHRTDFTVYTEAGAAFFDGRDPYAVTNVRGWHYLYPPLFAILVAPLHPLPAAWQGVIWFVLSLAMAGGCLFECQAIMRTVLRGGEGVRSDWRKIRRWVVVGAGLAVVFPILDTLQRGQVGLAVLWPLLIGFRLILESDGWPRSFLGGLFLSLSVTIKVTPALPVCVLLLGLLAGALRRDRPPPPRQRFLHAVGGVLTGLALCVLLIPALAVGWQENLRHLEAWSTRVATNERRGPDQQFNAHSVRNQSLANAVYRLGNWVEHAVGGGPDDRRADNLAPAGDPLPMDAAIVGHMVTAARALLLALLVSVAVRWRPPADALGQAAVFGLACAMTLPVSPISWGHHFVMLLPGALFVPLAVCAAGRHRAAQALAVSAAALLWAHYASLELAGGLAGRLGIPGIGMALWCVAASLWLLRRPASLSEGGCRVPAVSDLAEAARGGSA